MRKFSSFILYFIIGSLFVIIYSVIFHTRFEKPDTIWIYFKISQDLLFYLPLIGSLSLFWPQVFATKKDAQSPLTPAALSFYTLIFIFIMIGSSFLLQELAIPKLYNWSEYKAELKSKNIKDSDLKNKDLSDKTQEKFKLSEFEQLKYMHSRDNITFQMEGSFINFQQMVDGKGCFYVTGCRIISYFSNNTLSNITTADKGKIVDSILYLVSPLSIDYKNGAQIGSKRVDGIKKIPLIYNVNGIFSLSVESTASIASLIDIFIYNDYVYNSKVNFYHIGNIVFMKLCYYIVFVIMLILSGSIGIALRNRRLIKNEYFQTAAFYVISFIGTTLLYDTLVAVVNMIYGIVV